MIYIYIWILSTLINYNADRIYLIMSKVDIIVLVAALTIVAVRLYKKYFKKVNTGQGTGTMSDSDMSSSSKDDEYEPYLKK
jgi:hypothetical protein